MDTNDIPKVAPGHIQNLLNTVTYRYHQPEGTTVTFCFAFLHDKFYLGTGYSACVDPRLFNKELGEEYAKKDVDAMIPKKLWELEGYVLAEKIRTDFHNDGSN